MGKRVLITGTGTSGSWQIRGEQLGRAIGARVLPHAGRSDCAQADVVVIVKRCPSATFEAICQSGRPVVWDVVDAWPQRPGQSLDERESKRWLKARLKAQNPAAIVWPTARMMSDAGWGGAQIVLPHHAWPKYQPREIAGEVRIVGYEGAPHYLGRWRKVLEQECAIRGWMFHVNQDMQQADIGVALRDGGGWPAAHWKSNCKLANLQGLGIPALCSRECGYVETGSGSTIWIESPGDISAAFDRLASPAERERYAIIAQSAAPRLTDVADRYRRWLDAL